jgi:hypothetical protein
MAPRPVGRDDGAGRMYGGCDQKRNRENSHMGVLAPPGVGGAVSVEYNKTASPSSRVQR